MDFDHKIALFEALPKEQISLKFNLRADVWTMRNKRRQQVQRLKDSLSLYHNETDVDSINEELIKETNEMISYMEDDIKEMDNFLSRTEQNFPSPRKRKTINQLIRELNKE